MEIERTKPIKIGIIGSGKMGQKHIEAIRNNRYAKVVAIADPKLVKSKIPYNDRNSIGIFKTAEELLDKGGIDAVHIITPPNTHYNIAKTALKKNFHVFVEKPIVETISEAKELIKISKKRRLFLCSGERLNASS